MIKYTDIDISRSADNILQYLEWASVDDLAIGHSWYENAHRLALEWASDYSISLAASAGIIAAFSIDASWYQNTSDALVFLQSSGRAIVGRYGMVRNKASAILAGSCPADVLGTKKIYAFWLNIVNPRENTRVTIDRHAALIALQPGSNKPIDRRWYNTDRKYKVLEECYKIAASDAGISLPHELQAITWITHRRLYAEKIPGHQVEYTG